jgi:hypothetical protein
MLSFNRSDTYNDAEDMQKNEIGTISILLSSKKNSADIYERERKKKKTTFFYYTTAFLILYTATRVDPISRENKHKRGHTFK